MKVWYAVTARFSDPAVQKEYLDWLAGGHIQAVVAGGAERAQIVVMDGEGSGVQTQYVFPSAAAFESYVREHAPALRAEGLARFPSSRGVTFLRESGTIAITI